MGKYPATKDLKKHDHLEYWLDKTIDNVKAGKKSGGAPNPTPKKEEGDDSGYGKFLTGLLGAGGAAGLYYGAKKALKRKFPKTAAAVEVAQEAVPVIKRNAQKLLPAAQNTASNLQKKYQEAFEALNKRTGEGVKEKVKASVRPGTSMKESTKEAVKGETKQLQKGVRLKDVMPNNSDKIKFKTKETKLLPPASEKSAVKPVRKKKGK
jgi:hypothetical protein